MNCAHGFRIGACPIKECDEVEAAYAAFAMASGADVDPARKRFREAEAAYREALLE
jgi:hypothetical protein